MAAPRAGPEFVRELKAWARAHGIAALGVAAAEPLLAERAVLAQRRRLGLTSPFEEPDVELRVDPQRLLPGARSWISVAVSYYVPPPPGADPARTARVPAAERPHPDPRYDAPGRPRARAAGRPGTRRRRLRGWISRHAWGRDYHRVVRERLEAVAGFIAARFPEAQCRAFVDTGPPVDRAVAQRAGTGSVGKNCSVFVPGYGSWVVLGTLLTTLELPPDPPAPPPGYECLDCDLCIRACPTGALLGPNRLDPHRCLSYVTQMRGPVPEPWREALGNRIYGCDTCQAVCPRNRRLPFAGDPEFAPESEWDHAPDLLALLRLGNREFRRIYGGKASGWRGRTVLQRNAVLALGNLADARAVPALAELLRADPRPVIRGAAAWALGRIGGDGAVAALRDAEAREQDPAVRHEVAAALRRLGAG